MTSFPILSRMALRVNDLLLLFLFACVLLGVAYVIDLIRRAKVTHLLGNGVDRRTYKLPMGEDPDFYCLPSVSHSLLSA